MKKKLFILSLIAVLSVLTWPFPAMAAPETEAAEEVVGDPGEDGYILTIDELDHSYPHDAQLTFDLTIDPSAHNIGYSDLSFSLLDVNSPEGTTYDHNISWRDIDLSTAEKNGDKTIHLSQSVFVPEGTFEISYIMTDLNADYGCFAYQNTVNVRKGEGYYVFKALIGTQDFCDKYKLDDTAIPEVYRTMGKTILPQELLDVSEEAEKEKDIPDTEKEVKSYNVGTEDNPVFLRAEYVKTYLSMTNSQKDGFIKNATGSATPDQDFADYCKEEDIPLQISIPEYDHGENIKPEEELRQEKVDDQKEIDEQDEKPKASDEAEPVQEEKKKSSKMYLLLLIFLIPALILAILLTKKRWGR